MLGFRYLKTRPTDYIVLFKNGIAQKEGAGLSFLYYAPTSTVVSVPMASVDVPFAFEESTADFQQVSVQGQLTYRISDPKKIASMLDFSISAPGRFNSEDPDKLSQRLVSAAQVHISSVVHRMKLGSFLTAHEAVGKEVLPLIRQSPTIAMLGLEVLDMSILGIRPAPETAKALEAESREQLLRQADEAVYARRNAAVEQERRIKDSELNTELAVQEKNRQIREKKLQAEIAAEQQRATLIETRVLNERKEADSRAYALEANLKPIRDTDWRVLMAANSAQMDPRTSVALAFREIAENASKIGELHISPDLLNSLMGPKAGK